MNISEYYDALCTFDWYYEFSDDHRVWEKGRTRETTLLTVSLTSVTHKRLYDNL